MRPRSTGRWSFGASTAGRKDFVLERCQAYKTILQIWHILCLFMAGCGLVDTARPLHMTNRSNKPKALFPATGPTSAVPVVQ